MDLSSCGCVCVGFIYKDLCTKGTRGWADERLNLKHLGCEKGKICLILSLLMNKTNCKVNQTSKIECLLFQSNSKSFRLFQTIFSLIVFRVPGALIWSYGSWSWLFACFWSRRLAWVRVWAAIIGTFTGNEAHLQISICRGLLDSLAGVDWAGSAGHSQMMLAHSRKQLLLLI